MQDNEMQQGSGPNDARAWQAIEKLLLASNDEQRRARRWSVFFRALAFAYLFLLIFLWWTPDHATPIENTDHVALVEVRGMLLVDTDANADSINAALRDAFEAKHAKAVVVRLNSPGGSPVQAGLVYDEIRRLRSEYPDKKLYAVIEDMGASGAYYIAAAADEIYVDKASIVGSIGVIMNGFGFEELMRKVGVESRTLTAGENKAILDPFAPLSPEHRTHLQGLLDTIHAQFIAAVREGRGERLKDDPSLFTGLFWTGEQAVQLGLADGLGSVDHVAREIVGVEELVDYTWYASPLQQFLDRFGVKVGEGAAAQLGIAGGGPHLR
jgi:protease-4